MKNLLREKSFAALLSRRLNIVCSHRPRSRQDRLAITWLNCSGVSALGAPKSTSYASASIDRVEKQAPKSKL